MTSPERKCTIKKGDEYLHVIRKRAIKVDNKGKIITERVIGLNTRVHEECLVKKTCDRNRI